MMIDITSRVFTGACEIGERVEHKPGGFKGIRKVLYAATLYLQSPVFYEERIEKPENTPMMQPLTFWRKLKAQTH